MAAAGRAERGVGGVPDPAVAEVVGVRPVRAEDPAAPQLVQRGYERLPIQAGRGGQHVRGERPPDGRSDPPTAAASGDSRASRPVITACTFEEVAGASGRSASTTNSGLPSLSAYRRPSPAWSSGALVTCPASRAVSSRLSRVSPISVRWPDACSAEVRVLSG